MWGVQDQEGKAFQRNESIWSLLKQTGVLGGSGGPSNTATHWFVPVALFAL